MKIRWLGHACFLITAASGTRILTDPYDDSIGYKLGKVEAEVVTVSHDHFDHGHVRRVSTPHQVMKSSGSAHGIGFKGVKTDHDREGGRQRGANVVFVFEVDGIRVAHLGDLGHVLTPAQEKEIGPVDVILLPVGGVYTINANEASQVAESLNPKIVIPMHFKTKDLSFDLDPIDRFLQGKGNVHRVETSEIEITRETLPARTEIRVLTYG